MPFQSPEPIMITTDVSIQAGETTARIPLVTEMGPGEQMQIYGVYLDIYPGNTNLGDIDDDNIDEFTYTDIDDLYLETRDTTYAGFPLCCDPRPWEDLDMRIWIGDLNIPNGWIDLSVFGGAGSRDRGIGFDEDPGVRYEERNTLRSGKMDDEELPMAFPVVLLGTQTLALEIRNNNPANPTNITYSAVKITLIADIVASPEHTATVGESLKKGYDPK